MKEIDSVREIAYRNNSRFPLKSPFPPRIFDVQPSKLGNYNNPRTLDYIHNSNYLPLNEPFPLPLEMESSHFYSPFIESKFL